MSDFGIWKGLTGRKIFDMICKIKFRGGGGTEGFEGLLHLIEKNCVKKSLF